MKHRITIIYMDELNNVVQHVVDGEGELVYKNVLDKPIRVARFMQEGIVLDRELKGGGISRHGSLIPPSRFVRIYWEDIYEPRDKRQDHTDTT